MARRRIAVQVKDRKVGAPDVQQLGGATIGQHSPDTTLIFESKGASRDAHKEAERIERDTGMKVKFWNIFGRG